LKVNPCGESLSTVLAPHRATAYIKHGDNRRTFFMAKIEIYSSLMCGYCARAAALLDRKGVSYETIDVYQHPERRDEMISRAGGRQTVPQIFINDEHIGGSDDLYALDRAGGLDEKLAA
jgi:glutaredoxin 3